MQLSSLVPSSTHHSLIALKSQRTNDDQTKEITIEPLYKDTREIRTSPLIGTLSVVYIEMCAKLPLK